MTLLLLLACSCSGPVDTASPDADDTAPAEAVDADQDGSPADVDCDDSDPDVHPGAEEACGDGVDQDCDGVQPACSGTMPASESAGVVFGGDRVAAVGQGLAVLPDWLGNGQPVVVVGAPATAPPSGGDEEQWYTGAIFGLAPSAFDERSEIDASATWEVDGVEAGTGFGWTMAIGDLDQDGFTDLVAGTPYWTSDTDLSGEVRIIHGPVNAGGTLESISSAWVRGQSPLDGLGTLVQVSHDATGDAAPDIVAGWFGHCAADAGPGGFYVLDAATSGNTQVGPDAPRYDVQENCWGAPSALEVADLDGDGVDDVVVGAKHGGATVTYDTVNGYTRAPDGPGHVYIEFGPLTAGGDLVDADALLIGPDEDSLFGRAVENAVDLDGDGLSDLVVGAPSADTTAENSGSVYMISGAGVRALRTAEVSTRAFASIIGDRTQNLGLGYGVSTGGDIDADGHLDLLVSAQGVDDNKDLSERGHVYAFRGTFLGTMVHSDSALRVDGNHGGDHFGYKYSDGGTIYGGFDLNADGYDDWIAGAELVDEGQIGAAYLFYGGVWE